MLFGKGLKVFSDDAMKSESYNEVFMWKDWHGMTKAWLIYKYMYDKIEILAIHGHYPVFC